MKSYSELIVMFRVTEDFLINELKLRKIKRLSSGWFMACCPFHNEDTPSFGVHKDSGAFNCFACGATGTFLELVAHCKMVSLYEAEKIVRRAVTPPGSRPNVKLSKRGDIVLDDSILAQYRYYHKYLERRGITKETAKRFEIGYDKESRALVFPWRDVWGRLRTVKYRSVRNKKFWFISEGEEKGRLLYLVNHVKNYEKVFIVEGEIDAVYCWQNGLPTVALGGCHMTQEQVKQLLLTGVKSAVLFLDNDEKGRSATEKVRRLLRGRVKLYQVEYPEGAKDANEMTPEVLANLTCHTVSWQFQLKNLKP